MHKLLFAIALLLAGCASAPESVGSRSADKPKEVVQFGVVEAVTPIELDDSSYAGANVGGVFGQVGGASGGGRGGAVGSILGGVLGSTLGHQAGIATKPGLEIWVKLDESGKSAYVMQPGKPDEFKAGDRVRVINKNGAVKVEPVPPEPAPVDTAPKSELAPERGTTQR
jgi:outer membrane lipoprotein SlyB